MEILKIKAKTKRIGNFQIIQYPKSTWVRYLPCARAVRRFSTVKQAEEYVNEIGGRQ